ncbi:DUF3592 domain-containing protein [Sediminivirga luteola]|uniref:DUF3592 domain-containing protein n=1 Tax=Sediminivirga luteola TaxID=1774748 RepID=A0A8J2TZT6_9MICO|nr:DUF3592 domain-containing protein [Sediminivirga luteola]MCI2264086.1 DUF3592 domain-containing protein [Sediminivirga luteola]GGA22479.1 hypothetical protein GCM10011333_26820 [Sediminivirga luteola]
MTALLLPVLGIVLVLGLCTAAIIAGAVRLRRRHRLTAEGVPVRATIVAVRAQSVDSTYAYHPMVRYQFHGRWWDSAPSGGQHALRTGTVFKTSGMGQQFIGQQLDVLVDPRNPAISAVPGRDRLGIFLIALGAVFGGLFVILGVLGAVAGILSRL